MKKFKIFLLIITVLILGKISYVLATESTGSATVTVVPAPTASISVSPTNVSSGGSSTISWSSTNATGCTATGDWSGGKATSGSSVMTSISSQKTYGIYCTGDGGNSSTVTATVTVNPQYTISVSPGTGCSMSPSGTNYVNSGGSLSVSTSVNANYSLQSFVVDGTTQGSMGSSYTFSNVTSNHSISMTCTPTNYLASTSAGAGGSISPASLLVPYGSTGSFTITPNTGYNISSVSGCGGTLSGSTYTTGIFSSACTVTATFTVKNYTVSTSAGSNCTISPSSSSVSHGSSTTFTVTPAGGYTASASGCSGSLSGTTYTTGAITSACTVSASCAQVPATPTGFSASASSCGNNWLNLSWNSVSGATSYQVYRSGTLVYNSSGTSFSDTGLTLGGWYSYSLYATGPGGTSGGTSTSGTVASSCVVTYSLSITTTGTGGGSVSGAGTYNSGTSVNITATPNASSTFAGWSGNADCVDGNVTMSASKSCTATFTAIAPPATPTGLSVSSSSCENNWLNISWNASSGATNYKVYRDGTLVYNNSGTSFSDSGLSLNGSYSYVVNASNAGGTSSNSSAVWGTVSGVCPISVSISASPTSMVIPTNSTTLTWTTTGNPTSCVASNYWSGAKTASGGSEVRTGMTAQTYNYIITCSKSGTSDATSNVNVVVNNPAVPIVSLSASPLSGPSPLNTTLTWAVSGGAAVSCTAGGGWSGSKTITGGSQSITGILSPTTYTLYCTNAGGNSNTASVVVNSISPITVSLSATPSSMVLPTSSTTLTWVTTGNPDSCVASNYWSGAKTASGGSEVRTGMKNQTYNYIITCSKAGVSNATDSVNVVVSNPPIPATPTGLWAGASACDNNWLNISWNTSSGATNYKVYRDGALVYDADGTSFSDIGLTLGNTYSYTITASNIGGTSAASSSVSGTVADVCNIAPNAPTITGPTTFFTDWNQNFNITGTDPDAGDTIRYGIDWDNNGVADSWSPTGIPFYNSGETILFPESHSWPTVGLHSFKAITQDIHGANSPWSAPFVVDVTQEPDPAVITKFDTIPANKRKINFEEFVTLTWEATGATSCALSSSPGTSVSMGSLTPTTKNTIKFKPLKKTTYTLECFGPGRGDTESLPINVGEITPSYKEI